MKKVVYLLLILMMVLGFAFAFMWYKNSRREQALQERLHQATLLLREENYAEVWQLMQNDVHYEHTEVQYVLFLAAFGAAYYDEALNAWEHLPLELQQKQSAHTLSSLAAYAQQIERYDLRDALMTLAFRQYPDNHEVKEMRDWKFPLVKAKKPSLNLQSAQEVTARVDRNSVQKYLDGHDLYHAGQVLEQAIQKGLHQDDAEFVLTRLASIYIDMDMHQSYLQLADYVAQNHLNIDLPAYFGNLLSNFVNGGDVVLHKGKLYTSRYYNNYLGFWETDFLHRSADDFSTQKIPAKTLLETPVSYLNARENDLYFIALQEGNQVKKYSLTEGNVETLVARAADQLFLAGHFLYYRDLEQKHIYRFDLHERKEERLIAHTVKSYVYTDDGLYFINADEHSQVQLYTFANKEMVTMIDRQVDELVTDGARLVYINGSDENRIWQTDLQGHNSNRLLDWTDCSSLHLTEDGNLYFSQWALHRLDIRHQKVEQLSEYKALRIQTAEDKVIFVNENFDGYRYIALPSQQQSFVIDP